MKKILIIEDEPVSALRLKNLMLHIDDTLEIDGPLESVAEVVDYIQSHNDYDLILADVSLRDGKVFDAFKQVPPSSFVIFTTAYDEYSMDAIKSNGIDYLIKPIDKDELRDALQKVNLAPIGKQSVDVCNRKNSVKHRFVVFCNDEIISIEEDEIDYFCRDGRTVNLVSSIGQKYDVKYTMQELEKTLDKRMFFQLNRQYIVNYKALVKVVQHLGSKLKVKIRNCSDDEVFVSKERAVKFKEWLGGVF